MGQVNWSSLIGTKFNKLTVIDIVGKDKHGFCLLNCKCDCGNETVVIATVVKQGKTKSCGCLHKEVMQKKMQKHGMTNTRIFRIWQAMINRCKYSNGNRYSYYAGKGIRVCDEWSGKDGFENFYKWSINNGYDESLSIDRIDNDGNYSPDNCRWTDVKTQNNNRSSCRYIEYNGETKNIKQWSEYFGFNYKYFHERLKKCDWNIDNLLRLPYFKQRKEVTQKCS